MLLIPNRYATAMQVVDDGHLFQWLGQPLCCSKEMLPAIMLATPSGQSGRGHAAIGELTALIIEYDSGLVTMEDFAEQHGDLQWFLFTTSSHTPEHHRFRAILPLAEPVDYRVALDHRPAVNEYFEGCDPMSLINYQGAPRATQYYTWRCNTGEHYSFDRIKTMVAERPELMRSERPQASMWVRNCFGQKVQIKDPARYADAIWDELLEELWSIPRYSTGGRRHIPFFRVIRKLCEAAANGQYLFTEDEIRSVIAAHTPDEKRRKMVEQQLKRRA